jgi:orotate phosphoribosyltransferase
MGLIMRDLIQFLIDENVLQFGDFTLKSGRQSPYFFNFGQINTGAGLQHICSAYAEYLASISDDFDVIFGPAYKGIPLATTTAAILSAKYGIDKPWVFNRKEKKAHGEAGLLVGSELKGRVLILDDALSAGTAVRESITLIQSYEAEVTHVVFALDRQEKGKETELSTTAQLAQDFELSNHALLKLNDIVEFIRSSDDDRLKSYLPDIEKYRSEYGA